jgi:hypothetical protein
MKLLKPNPDVVARLDKLEEDHFVSAGTHRLEGPGAPVRPLAKRQKILVDRVRQKNLTKGSRKNPALGRVASRTVSAEN